MLYMIHAIIDNLFDRDEDYQGMLVMDFSTYLTTNFQENLSSYLRNLMSTPSLIWFGLS
jgi:hypothetical protein